MTALPTPGRRKVAVYVDGQNLFLTAKEAFGQGFHWPSYDVQKLAALLAGEIPNSELTVVAFYTGVPESRHDAFWHEFWNNKLRGMTREGIRVFKGRVNVARREKGVDVRIAMDLLLDFFGGRYETAIVVSQDRDFEAAFEHVREFAGREGKDVAFVNAFPSGAGSVNTYPLRGARGRPITLDEYKACMDPHDYRPKNIAPSVMVPGKPVNGPQVNFARVELGLTREDFARLFKATQDEVIAWEKDRVPVPDYVQVWLGPLVDDPSLLKRMSSRYIAKK